jgi:hypothetical protein
MKVVYCSPEFHAEYWKILNKAICKEIYKRNSYVYMK